MDVYNIKVMEEMLMKKVARGNHYRDIPPRCIVDG
jgi:hypothetical protein